MPYDPYTRYHNVFQCSHKRNVLIALTMAALYDLEVKAADILNAYVMATNHEKIWTLLGLQLGDNAGESAIIFKVFYGCLF